MVPLSVSSVDDAVAGIGGVVVVGVGVGGTSLVPVTEPLIGAGVLFAGAGAGVAAAAVGGVAVVAAPGGSAATVDGVDVGAATDGATTERG